MTNSRRITLYQPHLTHVLEAVAFEPHLRCIYYRCLQCDGAHSHKPAGFWFPRDCQWDSRSYNVNRCYWSPLRVALFFLVFFCCVFPSSYHHVIWSTLWISFIRYISYVSSFIDLWTWSRQHTFCLYISLHVVQLLTKRIIDIDRVLAVFYLLKHHNDKYNTANYYFPWQLKHVSCS